MIPLIFAMSIIIFIQVVCRYVFQNSLTWSEEMARYMFVWLVYFSVSYTARRKTHPYRCCNQYLPEKGASLHRNPQ